MASLTAEENSNDVAIASHFCSSRHRNKKTLMPGRPPYTAMRCCTTLIAKTLWVKTLKLSRPGVEISLPFFCKSLFFL